MKNHQQLTCFAGFDWAKDHHDVVIVDPQGAIIDQFRIEHSTAGWQFWKQLAAAHPGMEWLSRRIPAPWLNICRSAA